MNIFEIRICQFTNNPHSLRRRILTIFLDSDRITWTTRILDTNHWLDVTWSFVTQHTLLESAVVWLSTSNYWIKSSNRTITDENNTAIPAKIGCRGHLQLNKEGAKNRISEEWLFYIISVITHAFALKLGKNFDGKTHLTKNTHQKR